jgi:hypothetical protein
VVRGISCCSRSALIVGHAMMPVVGRCRDKPPRDPRAGSSSSNSSSQQQHSPCTPNLNLAHALHHQNPRQDDHIFKGHATESGTGLYAKALAATVGANHFNRVAWGTQPDPSTPGGSKRKAAGSCRGFAIRGCVGRHTL